MHSPTPATRATAAPMIPDTILPCVRPITAPAQVHTERRTSRKMYSPTRYPPLKHQEAPWAEMHHSRASWLLIDLTCHYKQPAILMNFNYCGGIGQETTRRPKNYFSLR